MGCAGLQEPQVSPGEGLSSDWPACFPLPMLGGASLRKLGIGIDPGPKPSPRSSWQVPPSSQLWPQPGAGSPPVLYNFVLPGLLWAPDLQIQAM